MQGLKDVPRYFPVRFIIVWNDSNLFDTDAVKIMDSANSRFMEDFFFQEVVRIWKGIHLCFRSDGWDLKANSENFMSMID